MNNQSKKSDNQIRGIEYISKTSVSLENISALQFGIGEENTFVASYRRLLQIVGEEIPYWYLMAVSGAAFRLQIHCNSWRMNSPDILTGFSLTKYLFNAFGVECECEWVCSNPEKIKIAYEKIIENIKRDIPSIGLSLDGKAYHGLVIGYTSRDKLLAIDYSIPGIPHAVAEKLVWCYHIPKERKVAMSTEEQFTQAFTLAEELYTVQRKKTFHLGLDAYDYWYGTLTNPSHHDPYKDDWLTIERNNGNHWIFVNLIDARRCASKYCLEMCKEFPEFRDELERLAELYDSMVGILQPLLDRQIVRPDKDINPARPWTKYERRKQALKLMEVKVLEEKALEEIKGVVSGRRK